MESSVGHILRCFSDSALTLYFTGPEGICCRRCLLRLWQEACHTYFVSLEGLCQEPRLLRIKTYRVELVLSHEQRDAQVPQWTMTKHCREYKSAPESNCANKRLVSFCFLFLVLSLENEAQLPFSAISPCGCCLSV